MFYETNTGTQNIFVIFMRYKAKGDDSLIFCAFRGENQMKNIWRLQMKSILKQLLGQRECLEYFPEIKLVI